MNDCNVKHYGTPPNSDMVLVCVKGIGRTKTIKRASYTEDWKKWYLANSDTECKPFWWSYLIEAE